MSDPMETGGVGKSPVIDKMNNLNAAENHANVVLELEKRVFQTEAQGARRVLQRRRQWLEDFQINFKRKEEKEDGNILCEGQQRVYTGGHSTHAFEDGRNRSTDGISGRVLSDGGREKAQVLPVERKAGYYFGKS